MDRTLILDDFPDLKGNVLGNVIGVQPEPGQLIFMNPCADELGEPIDELPKQLLFIEIPGHSGPASYHLCGERTTVSH
jgi:hypothetical protein